MPSFDRPADSTIPPSSWVTRWAPLIQPKSLVLDIAAGHGRHTRALRAMGFSVVAADIDTSGLTDLESDSQVEIITADLERAPWPLEDRTFGGVVVTNYLHRPHFPLLTSALANRGVMIFETFGQGNEHLGRPRNPDFLLKPGELLEAFGRDLQVVAYEHGEERDPRPAVRQRICVVNGPGPNALLHK